MSGLSKHLSLPDAIKEKKQKAEARAVAKRKAPGGTTAPPRPLKLSKKKPSAAKPAPATAEPAPPQQPIAPVGPSSGAERSSSPPRPMSELIARARSVMLTDIPGPSGAGSSGQPSGPTFHVPADFDCAQNVTRLLVALRGCVSEADRARIEGQNSTAGGMLFSHAFQSFQFMQRSLVLTDKVADLEMANKALAEEKVALESRAENSERLQQELQVAHQAQQREITFLGGNLGAAKERMQHFEAVAERMRKENFELTRRAQAAEERSAAFEAEAKSLREEKVEQEEKALEGLQKAREFGETAKRFAEENGARTLSEYKIKARDKRRAAVQESELNATLKTYAKVYQEYKDGLAPTWDVEATLREYAEALALEEEAGGAEQYTSESDPLIDLNEEVDEEQTSAPEPTEPGPPLPPLPPSPPPEDSIEAAPEAAPEAPGPAAEDQGVTGAPEVVVIEEL